jgi:hypothetical protein
MWRSTGANSYHDGAKSMTSLGDRRTAVRLEIVGSLWGSVQLTQAAQVVNISPGGALIMSPVSMPADSTAPVKVTIEGQQVTLDARVRHLRHVPAVVGAPAHFLIGLEFCEMPAALAMAFE